MTTIKISAAGTKFGEHKLTKKNKEINNVTTIKKVVKILYTELKTM